MQREQQNYRTVLLTTVAFSTGYLRRASELAVKSFDLKQDKDADLKLLSVITDPLTKRVIQVSSRDIMTLAARYSYAEKPFHDGGTW